MNYAEVVSTINAMFSNRYEPLFRPIGQTTNRKIRDTYYLATGDRIDDDTRCFISNVTDINTSYKVIIGRSIAGEIINETLFEDNEKIILCIIPEQLIGAEISKNLIVKIIHDMFNYIIESTKPYARNISIYSRVLDVLSAYLTVYIITTWFTGFEYDDFKELCTKEEYEKILSIDHNLLLNYSYIYALMINEPSSYYKLDDISDQNEANSDSKK